MSTTEPAAVSGWPWPRFFRYVYAAKFLCGELKRTAAATPEGPVEPGSYATAINLHNPHGIRSASARRRFCCTTAPTPRRLWSGTFHRCTRSLP